MAARSVRMLGRGGGGAVTAGSACGAPTAPAAVLSREGASKWATGAAVLHTKRLHSRRRHQDASGSSSRWRWSPRVAVAVLVNAALVGGLLPYTLSSAGADPVPTQLVFTTPPGDGSPGTALASQPVVTIEDSSNDTVSTSSSITLTLTGPGGAAQSGFPATLTCDQSGTRWRRLVELRASQAVPSTGAGCSP